ncbi:ATP-binding protein [Winogradskyella maritima]|uniref:histidine kinase n=1 Tax=Winogradskyella maritima TaxID=1517766 RepID=A0ABV8AJS2_9FLAO|nr:ATP-binding protein [Winogradskyella maritima]
MKQLVSILFIFILNLNAFAQEVYEIDARYPVHDLSSHLRIYKDSTANLTIDKLLNDSSLKSIAGDEVPFYLERHTTYWGKINLKATEQLKDWALHFEDRHIGPPAWTKSNGKIDVYGFVDGQQIFHKKSGVEYSKSERDTKAHWALNQVSLSNLPTNDVVTIIIKVQSNKMGYPAYFNLTARSPEQPFYHELFGFQRSFNMFLFGVAFIIFLYHVLQYIYFKDKVFLWFTIWLGFCTLTQAMTIGLILGTISSNRFTFWALIAHGIFYSWWFFGRAFINSKTKFPKADKIMLGLAIFVFLEVFILALLPIITDYKPHFLGFKLHYFIMNLYSFASLGLSIYFFTRQDKFARYFGFGSIIASTFLIIGTLWSLGVLNLIRYFDPFAVGVFLQIIIYSFGIAYRRQVINKTNETDKLNAQKTYAEMQRVKDLDDVKSKFFANISHELRTPLSLISGPLHFSKRNQSEQQQDVTISRKSYDVISNNVERLQDLIDQLLELSRLESGKVHLNLKQGGLIQFLKSIIFSFESMSERLNIGLNTSFPEEQHQAFYDRDKLEKIVSNLLSNAFKYSNNGGMVTVAVGVSKSHLTLKITDTGNGISEKDIARIFDRFYRVEGSETKGSGIGLALTKELVDIYNGQISVDSRLGEGTTFKVRLPFTLNHLPEAISVVNNEKTVDYSETTINDILPEITSEETKTESPSDVNKPLALIVEDNSDLNAFISQILKPHYRLLNAENGLQGERMAMEHIPDIIFTDVMMPKKDGFELCNALKNNSKTSHIPIVMLTAKAGQSNKMEGLSQGADAYVVKPFQPEELLVRASNLIANRRKVWEQFQNSDLISLDAVDLAQLDNTFLQKVAHSISENLDNETFSIEDLASAVGFSRSQLHRKLKALTNKSANQIVVEMRLNKAHEMLIQKKGSVSEIAYSVGYTNLSYFTKSFKEKFGLLPSKL